MKVCLVNPLTMVDFGDKDLMSSEGTINSMTPPLGILSLAAVLSERGITPQIININKLFFDFYNNYDCESSDFVSFIVQHIESFTSFDILGFGTKCNSYPITLRIAEQIKRLHPNIRIILGGPQASAVDLPTMKAFPFIDFIVRGEAEEVFPILVEAITKADWAKLEKIKGITFRRGNDIIQNPSAPPIDNLDHLPLPAYHLDPSINYYKSIYIEVGRGCPFSCTFCSTSGFFSRRFRLKSPQKIIEQMMTIKNTYNIDSISFTHDNFVADRKKVVELCEALLECKEKFEWSCSARTDLIDDELLALMSKAGCTDIFFGVETGSDRMQKKIKKNLNLSDAVRHIRSADQLGFKISVALITGFPEETRDDLRDTVSFFIDMLRFDNVEPQLSLLAPLARTEIHSHYQNELVLDHIYSDVSFQGKMQSQDEREMIEAYPEVFPNFYSIPPVHLDRLYFKEVMDFVTAISDWFRWLPLALDRDSGDMLNVFDEWQAWRTARCGNNPDSPNSDEQYYNCRQFPADFIDFVQASYIDSSAASKDIIRAAVQIENLALNRNGANAPESHEEPGIFSLASFPYMPPGVHIAQMGVDYKELLLCLREKKDLAQVPRNTYTYVLKEDRGSCSEDKILLLSPLSEELLSMCDGNRTVSEIISQSSGAKAHVDGVLPDKVVFFGLAELFKQGLIEVSTSQKEEMCNSIDLGSTENAMDALAE